MFEEALREIVEKTEGGLASLLMDTAGVDVARYVSKNAPVDIATVGIEYGIVLNSIRRAAESLDAGEAKEVAIATEKTLTLIRTLGDGYFVALAMRPDGNYGKGRYQMRMALPKLLAELE